MTDSLITLIAFGCSAVGLGLLFLWLVWVESVAYRNAQAPEVLDISIFLSVFFGVLAGVGTLIAYITCVAIGTLPLWTLVIPGGILARLIVDVTRWAKKKGARA